MKLNLELFTLFIGEIDLEVINVGLKEKGISNLSVTIFCKPDPLNKTYWLEDLKIGPKLISKSYLEMRLNEMALKTYLSPLIDRRRLHLQNLVLLVFEEIKNPKGLFLFRESFKIYYLNEI